MGAQFVPRLHWFTDSVPKDQGRPEHHNVREGESHRVRLLRGEPRSVLQRQPVLRHMVEGYVV